MADKNTLNGALEELGKLMATNLTTKGVASTYDMGLTTLANRILLINGGGELTISLTSDNDILSYTDGDSATLTATVLEGGSGVSGETVNFYKYVDGTNDVLLGSDVTDSNGEASYSYASTGVGDIQVYAKVRTLLTKTFALEDCWKYDASSSSGVSNYDTSLLNGSLSYDTTQSAYKVTKSSNGYGILFDNSVNLPVNVVITADMMVINGSGNHHIAHGIGLYDSSESLGVGCHFVKHHSAHEYDLLTFNTSASTDWEKDSNVSTSSNTWYHIEVEITDTTVTAKMYLNDTVISSHTHSNTVNSGNDNKLAFFQYVVNGTPYFKNIKVKPL